MSAYVRLVESLLVEMSNRDASRRGRGPSKNAQKRARRAAATAAAATAAVTSKDVESRNTPTPLSPAPNPAAPSPGAQDAIDNAKQDQETETKPETKPDKEDKTPEKEKPTPRYDLDRTSRGTTDVGNMLGASKYGRSKGAEAARKVRAKGGSNKDAARAARAASRSGEAQFRRGVDTIGKGAMSGVKKFLKTGQNVRPSGPLI